MPAKTKPPYLKNYPVAGKDYKLSLPKGHLSYTQISTYLKCPAQYYHQYVQGERFQKSAAILEGQTHHRVLEASNLRVLKGKPHLTPDIALKQFEKHYHDGKDTVDVWNGTSEEDILERAEWFTTLLYGKTGYLRKWNHEPVLVDGKPGVEWMWDIKLAGVPVKGVSDLVTSECVWDYKVSKRKTTNADNSLQLMINALATDSAKAGYVWILKTSKPNIEQSWTKIKSKRIRPWVEGLVARVAFGISNEIWTPCDESLWWCSDRWCSFWDRCKGSCV